MDPQPLLLFLVVLILCLFVVTLFIMRSRRMKKDTDQRPWRRLPPLWIALIALSILVLGGVSWFFIAQPDDNDQFVVLIAPFDDASDGQTGRYVAAELAQQMIQQLDGRIEVRLLEQRPADDVQALGLANAAQSDLLIWGQVEPGALLDSQSLSPRLIYTPQRIYAPNGWESYQGRFAMPQRAILSSEPINGQAVLPGLVAALADYSQGYPDRAAATLDRLMNDYPALRTPLLQALLGNVLWARGSYGPAADAYRLALSLPSSEQALLANNLGAILLDAGDPGVLNAFADAVSLLEGEDLGALRYNLGMLALQDQRPNDAAVELEQARNLLPPNAPLLVALANAYRESGRLASAEDILIAAERQIKLDVRGVPQLYRVMLEQRLRSAINEERAMLSLARSLAAQGPLTWELEVALPLPEDAVESQYNQLRSAIEASDYVAARWHQRSASDSATDLSAGQVATGQAERAENDARRQRYHLALLAIELARTRADRPTGGLAALFGRTNPADEGLRLLETLDLRTPDRPPILLAEARAYRVAEKLNEADRLYDRVLQLIPQRPEGYFGKAMVAQERGDSGTAMQLLQMAIERDPSFFPARIELAQIAQQRGDLNAAISQWRSVSIQRPGPAAAVPLAQALRLSGPTGYVEAEQVLLPLSVTDPAAAIELGRLYNDAGRPEASIQAYRDALRLDPQSSTAAFELGERLAVLGDLKAAEAALRDALRFDDRNIAARLALARLYEGPMGQPDRADKEYGIALDQGVHDLNTLILIGDTALGNQNPNQAINAYSKAVRLDPNSALPHLKLATAYLATNRLQSAEDSAQNVLQRTQPPTDLVVADLRAQALVLLGDVALRKPDLALARQHYTEALQISPQMLTAQLGMGRVAVGEGQWGVALGYFETATNLPGGTQDANVQFWLAEGLLRSGALDRAMNAYQQALAIRPTFPEALLGLAQLQYAQGDPATALQTVEQSIGQRGDYAEALLFKGKLLQEYGRIDQALVAYDASIRASSQIAETYYRRSLLLISTERYDKAINDLRRAVTLQPNFPEAHYWMGRAYYARNQDDQAHDAFKRAVDLNPSYTEALYYLGLAAEDLDRRDEAIGVYQTVILADGTGEWATRARDQLNRIE
ncbi:TPR repeat-containing protein [Oscillochloris trichoides DG-6]|uniref:TPR repeat-containing protein n=1 Tax=Oscillochloris trichoides DG-6 TaxID=765420 RepID=E1IEH9_9CHLR|nr:tetratricopeptide repeat protein [Oscillochloris trichoides]EFO80371.1 TPR repeat-containing protein [Oscillochloris trichoides DG-6]